MNERNTFRTGISGNSLGSLREEMCSLIFIEAIFHIQFWVNKYSLCLHYFEKLADWNSIEIHKYLKI